MDGDFHAVWTTETVYRGKKPSQLSAVLVWKVYFQRVAEALGPEPEASGQFARPLILPPLFSRLRDPIQQG